MEKDTNGFHRKYRPHTLSRVIGHEELVTRLNGIIKSGKPPSSLFFGGPTSSGKTTLARAFAASLNGVKNIDQLQGAFTQFNASAEGNKDNVREWIKISRYKSSFPYRVICIDEAQALLSNKQAADAWLLPLEEPPNRTIWIVCSMEPQRFATTETGRAILNRCQQFNLTPHNSSDLLKQAKRIMKGEKMDYAENILKAVVRNCNGEMRTLANLMEALAQYANGLPKLPKKLSKEDVTTVISTTQSNDDALAVRVIVGVLSGQYKSVVKALLDVAEPFTFITKLQWCASHLLRTAALEGAKHSQIKFWSKMNQDLEKQTKDLEINLGKLAMVNESIVNVKGELMSHASSAIELLEARMYRLMKAIHAK